MGATNFSDIVIVKGDGRDAYRKACADARDYNGHQDGYSGDIQTTSGFRMFTNHPRFGTDAFYKWENKMLDKEVYEKWGPAGCIELKGKYLKDAKERRGLKGKKGYRCFYFFGWGAC